MLGIICCHIPSPETVFPAKGRSDLLRADFWYRLLHFLS
jgi:hypothetical protein